MCPDPHTHSASYEPFQREVLERIHGSEDWRQHQAAVLLTAEQKEAISAETASASQVGIAPATKAEQPKRFPNRAAWLRQAMTNGVLVSGRLERPLTPNRLEVLGGPDSGTIARILGEEPVQSRSLTKLATGLGVSDEEIPMD